MILVGVFFTTVAKVLYLCFSDEWVKLGEMQLFGIIFHIIINFFSVFVAYIWKVLPKVLVLSDNFLIQGPKR